MQLADGWDYELDRNVSQWVKLCGDTFNPLDRDRNTVLLAARTFEGRTEVTPYYNIAGVQHYPERAAPGDDWPVVQVEPGRDIYFRYEEDDGRAWVLIEYDGAPVSHSIEHPGLGCFRFEVNFYFGGSEPAANTISIEKERL